MVYSQGRVALKAAVDIPTLNLDVLRAQCSHTSLSADDCYERFARAGFEYGPAHRGIYRLHIGEAGVLAELRLPATVSDSLNHFVLHPALLDAALQASIGMMQASSFPPYLPFALQELEVFGRCAARMWAFIRYSEGSTPDDTVYHLDIDLCNADGTVCARLTGFSLRALPPVRDARPRVSTENVGTLLFEPYWHAESPVPETVPLRVAQHLVILCESPDLFAQHLEHSLHGVRVVSLHPHNTGHGLPEIATRFEAYSLQVFEEIQGLLKAKPTETMFIQLVVRRQQEEQLFCGLSGLLKTAHIEHPKIIGQIIGVESWSDIAGISVQLQENSRCPHDTAIRYQHGERLIGGWREVEIPDTADLMPYKAHGVYLITGGAGGLGLIFANEIARQAHDATVILTGRSELNAEQHTRLNALRTLGIRIDYRQVDVTDEKAVAGFIERLCAEFGKLNGIIHSAGVGSAICQNPDM